MTHDLSDTIAKGATGMVGAISAKLFAVTQWQDQTSWWLGAFVAIGTAVNIGFDLHRKWRNRRK